MVNMQPEEQRPKLLLLGTFDQFIHSAIFDPVAKTLHAGHTNKSSMKPTWLTQHPTHSDIVYSNGHTEGKVFCNRIVNKSTGELEVISQVVTGGEAPTHMTVLPNGSALVIAHYRSGTTGYLPLSSSGSFSESAEVKHYLPPLLQYTLEHSRQGAPHAHQILNGPRLDGEVYVPDLGYNQVLRLKYNQNEWVPSTPFEGFLPGDGPRHSALHPNGKYLYTLCEISSTIVIHLVAKPASPLARVSIVPAKIGDGAKPIAAAINILPSTTPGGPHLLLATNRDLGLDEGDAIALYRLEDDGEVSLIRHESGVGKHLRGMAVDPDNHWICVAGRHGGGIVIFERVGTDGLDIKQVARLPDVQQVIAPMWLRI
ncbi:hypothetical protein L486_05730 [Kwoniella mangroviensis CBS 10435]|uniref:6-phosphogluconolactonase n=1 Tax=Kwoniella mangroviensis CBS 10435 TaxID=1331196 RepID=A0A1B9IMS9_9TREE|nr:uncharacterized protein I203_07377 [Kwoniella mangroviensis CBS 8507]OCF56875.1 hypothetical protein L486_05730 [Kwoniella mangroviensis CBS 10435]OCF63679.1 hypothetical protein I203_07377 [Kwoniella mangroviensis CBS 8507]OCF75445.1 hypothetical protein I204_04300 [Kwoniella mangroviensis CBS 8886]